MNPFSFLERASKGSLRFLLRFAVIVILVPAFIYFLIYSPYLLHDMSSYDIALITGLATLFIAGVIFGFRALLNKVRPKR